MIEWRLAGIACRALTLSQLRDQPGRLAAGMAAIALGVALGTAVHLINAAALADFEQAARDLIGSPDIIVRGPSSGFDDSLFAQLARVPGIADASPVLELELSLVPSSRAALKLLALDPMRAAELQPALMGALGADLKALFAHDAIVLSRAAADEYELARGDTLTVDVAGEHRKLRVIDVLPGDVYPDSLGLMDIAAAQWTLGRLNRINRVDLRLQAGSDPSAVRERLAALLPTGVFAVTPGLERGRAASATRAYRVNLSVLALVALMTGAFVVFSSQWLSVLRRRVACGLLRALGVTRAALRLALFAETALIGLAGSVAGLLLGVLIAALMLHYLGADLGNRQLSAAGVPLRPSAWALLAFAGLGMGAACAGGALPAMFAARRAPALALKAGDAEEDRQHLATHRPAVALLLAGFALAWLPPVGGLPVGGYASIAAVLLGAVLLVPAITQRLITRLPRTGHAVPDTAFAQLQGSLGSGVVSLASIIVSFSLMVAMAIMVHSFRDSFDRWLVRLLPSDLQLRPALGSDTATLTPALQRQLDAIDGIAQHEYRRLQPIYLRSDAAPVTLIARDFEVAGPADALPLVQSAPTAAPRALTQIWISEPLQDQYGYAPGQTLELPLAGQRQSCFIAGVWRDYVRAGGAIVMRRTDYVALTGDRSASEASFWRDSRAELPAISSAIHAVLGADSGYQLLSSPELRERSLQAFDRAFLVTYALEAIAVLLGLIGVGVAASATALARRAQFGMLRHIGMLRRQVLWMFASEGIALSGIAVLYGLSLGAALSVVLIYVVNRQSFHWSIDLAVPWSRLAALSLALILASALTALWSGRAALSADPIRAVREDW